MTTAPVRLPPLLVLTDRHQCDRAGHSLPEVVAAMCGASVPAALVFREKDLARPARARLGADVQEIVAAAGWPLIVASDHDLAAELGAAAVHLAANDTRPPHDIAHGRSCHDADDLRTAVGEGAAYVTVSPIFLTDSKPGYGPALGPSGLASLVDAAKDVPLYALGGITPARVPECIAAGAAGVAVMGAVMGARDPGAVMAELGGRLLETRR